MNTEFSRVLKAIEKIKFDCNEIETLKKSIESEYNAEAVAITEKSFKLQDKIKGKFDEFKKKNFDRLRDEISSIVEAVCLDYQDEFFEIRVSDSEYAKSSYEENKKRLHFQIESLNNCISELNNTDFDELVPPVTIEMQGENFVTRKKGQANAFKHSYQSMTLQKINDPKPIRELAKRTLLLCEKIDTCLDVMTKQYEQILDIPGFCAHVEQEKKQWLDKKEAELNKMFEQKVDKLFIHPSSELVSSEFFVQLANNGKRYDTDLNHAPEKYRDVINIGDAKLAVENNPVRLSYIYKNPALKKHLDNGSISTPVLLNLKEKGNILLNVNEDSYSSETIDFVDQLIIQFLMSFPANRIKFCLVDVDNKMGFSQFKGLTKINNDILFNGIIRDDRQLENTIKDMEQTMYKIDDDVLSYNNVEDIYEYNERFEANPQSVHLFVLVNYPTAMRDDIAKRVMKILANGNRAGIFSIIINNNACQLPSSYKKSEYDQFIKEAAEHSLVIGKLGNQFCIPSAGAVNIFVPKQNITSVPLSKIIETLQGSVEESRQKVIPLAQMFAAARAAENSNRGIASSAEVLDIPIGARGGEVQNLLLKTTGDGSAHAVVIGGTGSGKSNLLHTIIMSACYKYSPEELNLYLIDFKGGVEFKYYEANKVRKNQMPHIKLTGLTSDLEDGVAILNNLHKELRRREDEFRKCRVEDIVQYRNLGKMIPRLFVIIDEIQELFEQDDRLGQKAIDILRELFKKGRAFGINILWASQNIPKAPGLKDKVLSQIGNRISLRLNEPEDALDIKIDPKVVKNLNRPEKGLGVINDIRYGNESIEFRVAYAETSENRQKYSQEIIDKWRRVANNSVQEPLFIVGDDDEPSPIVGNTIYSAIPTKKEIVSKSFDNYVIQLGQDYVTGKPFDINISLRENKMNLLLAGYDIELIRDMMGYSLLSVLINQLTNADCVSEGTKIYYANGEMINPKNSDDLFNVVRSDFSDIIENVSSTEYFVSCISDVYKTYKERSIESDSSEYAKAYTPRFVVVHSLQRYTDLLSENPKLIFSNNTDRNSTLAESGVEQNKLNAALSMFSAANSLQVSSTSNNSSKSKMPDYIPFADAIKELLDRGGKFGIHFIISIDNPLAISAIKNDVSETMYKVFVKGVNANVVSQMLGDYKIANSLNNSKVALVAMQDERTKVRVYRYDHSQDAAWYKQLCVNYKNLRRGES